MHTVYIIDDDENLKNKLNEEFKKDDNKNNFLTYMWENK